VQAPVIVGHAMP